MECSYTDPLLEPIHAPHLTDPDAANGFLDQAGLDVDNMNFIWEEIGYGQPVDADELPIADYLTPEQYRNNCIQRIYYLEKTRRGRARAINQRHGIYNFGRIPLRSLLLQGQPGRFRRRMWAGFVAADFNGALMDSAFCLDHAHKNLTQPTDLAIDEYLYVDDLTEQLERRAREWRRDSVNPPSADLIMLAAHGRPDYLFVYEWYGGRGGTRQELRQEHIEGALGAALLGISNPNTVVLVDACLTAAGDNSLSEAIHERTGLHTIGATAEIATAFIRLREARNDGLAVTPGFYTSKTQGNNCVYKRSPARHFRRK